MEDSDPQQALKRRALRSKHDKRETSGSSNSKSKRRDGATGGECDGAADRSLAEAAVSTLFHAIVLGYYVFVLFAEVEALKPRPEAARVMGGTTFGGRWNANCNLAIIYDHKMLIWGRGFWNHGYVSWIVLLARCRFYCRLVAVTLIFLPFLINTVSVHSSVTTTTSSGVSILLRNGSFRSSCGHHRMGWVRAVSEWTDAAFRCRHRMGGQQWTGLLSCESSRIVRCFRGLCYFFQDRYTGIDRFTPSIDQEQNWFLIDGTEEEGNTTLRFWRNFTSCDTEFDLTISVNTTMTSWLS